MERLIYLFTEQIFKDCLLCVKHNLKNWKYSNEIKQTEVAISWIIWTSGKEQTMDK